MYWLLWNFHWAPNSRTPTYSSYNITVWNHTSRPGDSLQPRELWFADIMLVLALLHGIKPDTELETLAPQPSDNTFSRIHTLDSRIEQRELPFCKQWWNSCSPDLFNACAWLEGCGKVTPPPKWPVFGRFYTIRRHETHRPSEVSIYTRMHMCRYN